MGDPGQVQDMRVRLRLVGGRVIDPASGVDTIADVVIEHGRIVGVARGSGGADGEQVLDAAGYVVSPGFVDLHCHLREPGYEDKETVATGTRAAAAGGFTTVCAMPNTRPTADTGSDVEALLTLARRDAAVRVLPIGTVTKQQEGRELSEMADMSAAGAVAFSDDGNMVRTSSLMRHALEYSLLVGKPIADHAEDPDIVAGGVINEGPLATHFGLKGVPREAEEVAVARDLALARLTGGRLHLAHLSTAGAVEQVRRARAAGTRVTAEVTPHHLLLTEAYAAGNGSGRPYDTNARVNPPLRTESDAEALLAGLREGTIDCIATDHAPHRWVDKACEFDQAAPGISGLETAFGLLMRLVHAGKLALPELIAALTWRPCSAWDLPYGTLAAGTVADVVVLDPERSWVVDTEQFISKGKNSPLHGQALRGAILLTIAEGSVAYRHGL
jgi:dihydroorotase